MQLWWLKQRLENRCYHIGGYSRFMVHDPKEREIQALSFGDRMFQHLLCDNVVKPYFERRLIYDNAACREGKGTHFAMGRLEYFLRRHYKRHGTAGYILKYDIRKYFNSMDHEVLKRKLAGFPDEAVSETVCEGRDDTGGDYPEREKLSGAFKAWGRMEIQEAFLCGICINARGEESMRQKGWKKGTALVLTAALIAAVLPAGALKTYAAEYSVKITTGDGLEITSGSGEQNVPGTAIEPVTIEAKPGYHLTADYIKTVENQLGSSGLTLTEKDAGFIISGMPTASVDCTLPAASIGSSTPAYATKEDLLARYDLDGGTIKTVQKVYFGYAGDGDSTKTPQVWKIAGKDEGIKKNDNVTDNIVLFADTAIKTPNGNADGTIAFDNNWAGGDTNKAAPPVKMI